jgi:ketosteroid isomerase-like protein
MQKRAVVVTFLLVLYALACASTPRSPDTASLREALIRTDSEFSRMSETRGAAAAFAAYIAPEGIVLAEYPARRGIAAVENQFSAAPPGSRLTWKPAVAEIAESGDLGYTVGTYELHSPAGLVRTGKYMTVWKKQPDGSWKFVADGGTPDPPRSAPAPVATPQP